MEAKRFPIIGEKVKVYRNLHKKQLSVMDRTGRVICWKDSIVLVNATFIVRPAGREKVLRTKRKNVHAFVEGKYRGDVALFSKEGRRTSYNPYKADRFMCDGRAIIAAETVEIYSSGEIWIQFPVYEMLGKRFAGWSEGTNVFTVEGAHGTNSNEWWCRGDQDTGLWLYDTKYIKENAK